MTIEDLKKDNLVLLEVISGSKAFGLDTPASDTDIKGVYYLPRDYFFGLNHVSQISDESNDIVYYEIGRFIELLLKNNPNILEILATPEDCILYKHPIMDNIKLEDFLSRLSKDTFTGYAATQIKKAKGLKKKILNPVEKEKKTLLSFCYVLDKQNSVPLKLWLTQNNLKAESCGVTSVSHIKGMYNLYYDNNGEHGYKGIIHKETSNEVSLSPIPKDKEPLAPMYCNQEAYSSYCKEYKEYWEWIEKRNEDRYNVNKEHGKNYDSKNMMHTIRLLQTAEQILSKETLTTRVDNRAELLNIKAGNVDYDDLLLMAENIINSIEKHTVNSQLPECPDKEKAERILIEIREHLYINTQCF